MTDPAGGARTRSSAGRSGLRLLRSFRYAGTGLITLLREQANARIHLLATVLVAGAGLLLNIRRSDWLILLLCMALVWVAEALNTALEYLCDATVEEQHPLIGKAKDIAAAGVLIAAAISALAGLLVLLPYL